MRLESVMKMTNISVLIALCLVFSLASGNFVSSYSKYKSEIPLEARLQKLVHRFEASESKWQQMVTKQEMEIIGLKAEVAYQKSLLNHMKNAQPILQTTQIKAANFRTCDEIFRSDPTSPSGNYTIDPDGNGEEEPFEVFCDMTTGATLVGHNSETPTRITNCSAAGCYERSISYVTSARQLELLTRLSGSCRQYIKFNCLGVPFEFNNVAYAWWTDREGEIRRFWAGSFNESIVHTCQCGLDGTCVDQSVTCNCDALAPEAAIDEGYVTEMDLLPVTKLNFGRASASSALGIHTLGKFECSGRPTLDGPPSSCGDLWQIGYSLNGIFVVKSKDEFRTVYCDFSKLPGEEGQEMEYGAADVKQTVYFYAQRTAALVAADTPISFETLVINLGGGIAETGIFTAPVAGVYFFAFDGAPASVLLKIGTKDAAEVVDGSLSATVELAAGDTVTLVSKAAATSSPRHYSGLLLKQTAFP